MTFIELLVIVKQCWSTRKHKEMTMRVEVLTTIHCEAIPEGGKLEAQPNRVSIKPGVYVLKGCRRPGFRDWLFVKKSRKQWVGLTKGIWDALIKAEPPRVKRLPNK